MLKKYTKIKSSNNINDIIAEIVYLYLFDGLSVTEIEMEIFNTRDYKGWFSKSILNFVGIDTSGENKGVFHNKTVEEGVNLLYNTKDIDIIKIAKILKDYYL